MRAALAHEQHQPVVRSRDEAVGAAKLPRSVYGLHSNLRLEVTTLAKLIIGNDGNRRAAVADRKGRRLVRRHPGSAYSAGIASQNGFSTAQRV